MQPNVLIVGAGIMGRAHALAGRHLGYHVTGLSRSQGTADAFTQVTGFACRFSGLAATPEVHTADLAVVSVNVDQLLPVSLALLAQGARRLLVEKPAGLDISGVSSLADAAEAAGATVHVAYNRRFYPSVRTAAAMVAEDGGATSLRFDFTERSDVIATLTHPPVVKAAWFLANSTHVVDLAFHLGGWPETLQAQVDGALPWHPTGSRFAGHGRTETGASFSYHADWDAPGRWSVEVRTRRRRLVLEPLEELRVQAAGTFTLAPVDLTQTPAGLKPGVVEQLRAAVEGEPGPLVGIAEHAMHMRRVYAPMGTGA